MGTNLLKLVGLLAFGLLLVLGYESYRFTRNVKAYERNADLITAAVNGDAAKAEAALDAGADVNYHNLADTGNTALMLASQRGDAALVGLLLARGADTDIRSDIDGGTALMKAGSPETAALLLQHGADTEMKDNQGRKAVEIVEDGAVRELIRRQRRAP